MQFVKSKSRVPALITLGASLLSNLSYAVDPVTVIAGDTVGKGEHIIPLNHYNGAKIESSFDMQFKFSAPVCVKKLWIVYDTVASDGRTESMPELEVRVAPYQRANTQPQQFGVDDHLKATLRGPTVIRRRIDPKDVANIDAVTNQIKITVRGGAIVVKNAWAVASNFLTGCGDEKVHASSVWAQQTLEFLAAADGPRPVAMSFQEYEFLKSFRQAAEFLGDEANGFEGLDIIRKAGEDASEGVRQAGVHMACLIHLEALGGATPVYGAGYYPQFAAQLRQIEGQIIRKFRIRMGNCNEASLASGKKLTNDKVDEARFLKSERGPGDPNIDP